MLVTTLLLAVATAFLVSSPLTTTEASVVYSQPEINNFKEGDLIDITVRLDEPIICADPLFCDTTIYFDSPEPELIAINPCYAHWNYNEWQEERTIQVRYVPQFRNRPNSEFVIQPRIESDSHFYAEYIPPSITVRTLNIPTARCSGTGDPHYTTFDGYYYHFYGNGKEWLSRSNNGKLLVQTITHRGPPSRNCAIAVLENGNYFMISVCSGSINMVTRNLNPDYSSISLTRSGCTYNIEYNSGVSITFSYGGSNANIYITLPGNYYGQVDGLCGNWDGSASNDSPSYRINSWNDLPSNWKVTSDLDLFSVNDNIIRSSIINDVSVNPLNCAYEPILYVRPILNNPDIEDLTSVLRDITFIPEVEETIIINGNTVSTTTTTIPETTRRTIPQIATASRNFGQSSSSTTNNDITTIEQEISSTTQTTTTEDNIIIEELLTKCNELLNRPEIDRCINVPELRNTIMLYTDTCMEDVMLLREEFVIEETWETIKSYCLQNLILETETDEEVEEIVNNICVTTCLTNSECIDGTCKCKNPLLEEPLCDIYKDSKPALLDVYPKKIDRWMIGNQPSLELTVANMSFNRNLTCKYKYKLENDIIIIYEPARFLGNNKAICSLENINNMNLERFNISIMSAIEQPEYEFKYNDNNCLVCNNKENCIRNPNKCFLNNYINDICYDTGSQIEYCTLCENNTEVFNYKIARCYPYFNTELEEIYSYNEEEYINIPALFEIRMLYNDFNNYKSQFKILINNDESICNEYLFCRLTPGMHLIELKYNNEIISNTLLNYIKLFTSSSTSSSSSTSMSSSTSSSSSTSISSSSSSSSSTSTSYTFNIFDLFTTTTNPTTTRRLDTTTRRPITTITRQINNTIIFGNEVNFSESNSKANISIPIIVSGCILIVIFIALIIFLVRRNNNMKIYYSKAPLLNNYLINNNENIENIIKHMYFTDNGTFKVVNNNNGTYSLIVKDEIIKIFTITLDENMKFIITSMNINKVDNPIYQSPDFECLDELVIYYSMGNSPVNTVLSKVYDDIDDNMYVFNNANIKSANIANRVTINDNYDNSVLSTFSNDTIDSNRLIENNIYNPNNDMSYTNINLHSNV